MGTQYFPIGSGGGGGGGGGSAYWTDPVANQGSLPASGSPGTITQALDTGALWKWNGAAWVLYYTPLPAFTSNQILIGNGTQVPAQDSTFTYDLSTKLFKINSIIESIAAAGLIFRTPATTQKIQWKPNNVLVAEANDVNVRFTVWQQLNLDALTASSALVLDSSKNVVASAATAAQVGYLADVTGLIQAALDSKLPLAGGTLTGALTLAADPASPLQAATKQYVDAVAQGLNVKTSVRFATTANITLVGAQTIDGGSAVAGNRILVKAQSAPAQNGIYVVAAGAWSRATDMDVWSEVPGAFVFVEEGTVNSDVGFVSTANAGGTIGVTAIPFSQFSSAGSYQNGNGLDLTGTIFSVKLDGATLSLSGSGVKVATGGISNNEIAAGAAVDVTKLAAVTAQRAVISDVNGKLAASAATGAEVGYLAGVTSPVQTQFNTICAPNSVALVNSNVSLTNRRLHLVDTSAARTLTLPSPAAVGAMGCVFLKDKVGLVETNNITVQRFGSENIETLAANYVITDQFTMIGFMTDGTDWWLI